jgi:hypothetical protein
MDKSVFTGSVTCDASSLAAINVVCGFYPSAVEVFNPDNGVKLWWTEDMTEGTANKIVPVAHGRTGLLEPATLSITSTKAYVNYASVYAQSTTGFTSTAAGTSNPAAATCNKSAWGAFGWSQKLADGSIATGPDSTVATFTTEALAIASIAATSAGYVRLGYVTVQSTAGASWVGATSTFSTANAYNIYSDDPLTVSALGISLYEEAEFTISSGTTPGGGIGFTIGADTDLQVLSATLIYKAWR